MTDPMGIFIEHRWRIEDTGIDPEWRSVELYTLGVPLAGRAHKDCRNRRGRFYVMLGDLGRELELRYKDRKAEMDAIRSGRC